ncbi:MAG TPA: hypothetical protein VHN15_07715, partial [Thermoanaerobaculia bacterium]|nr:hypothetical protein [Thermoanaerobaculia bacterium]
TLLVAEDRGGGSVILPGPEFSSLAFQDFSSSVLIGRARRDFGRSFASFVVTGRDIASGSDGGGHNVVLGPDFLWRPNNSDSVIAQFLVSNSQTPERPDLAGEWDGRSLESHALHLAWNRNTPTWDWVLQYRDLGDEFRADAGFVPQVGIRDSVGELGYSWYPETGILRGFRPFARVRLTEDRDGEVLLRRYQPALEATGFWNGRATLEYRFDDVRAGGLLFEREQAAWTFQVNPSRRIALIGLDGVTGEEVDFTNLRLGRGTSLNYRATIRPTDHLDLRFDGSRQWLDVRRAPTSGGRERLFTAEVARLRATYTFTARAFLRLIGQQTEVDRDTTLYGVSVAGREEDFSGSALFAYKLNWQTVLFLGYGDERTLDPFGHLEPASREVFLKVSYAFQR